jgi:hypothetical protein
MGYETTLALITPFAAWSVWGGWARRTVMAALRVSDRHRSTRLLWAAAGLAILLWLPGPAWADEMCQGSRPVDPRNSGLNVLEIKVAPEGITGRITNTSAKTAVGVMVWVNFFRSARGGLFGRQCMPIGDMAPGEERPFQGPPSAEAAAAESWTHAAEALDWR